MFSRLQRFYKEYKEIKYLAYHDSLTGLLNRNWLYKNINNINKNYIYFIDINNLHIINNKYGHTYGDEYIIKCINRIGITKYDYLIRYAGDEFILFTNYLNTLKTNNLFSVGFSENNGDINQAINIADIDMINSKKAIKKIKNPTI